MKWKLLFDYKKDLSVMKSILIPVDYSAFAAAAINTGIALARRTGAELFLLNIFDAPSDWNLIPVDQQQAHPEIEGRMVEAEIKMDKLTGDKLFRRVKVTGIVRPGIIREEIQRFAKLYKCDLIIMGAHGMGESQRYFIGSQAQKILRAAPCPVLSVKKDFKPQSIKKIVFAADFDENLIKVFGKLMGFIKATGAKVHLVYINTPTQFKESVPIEKGMEKLKLAYPELSMKGFVHNAKEVIPGLLEFAALHKIDIIAKITHDRKHRPGYDIGVTESLLFKSKAPILSVVAP